MPLNKCIPVEQLGDAPLAGALRTSVSTPCEPLCPSSQPSNMSFPVLSRHGLTVPCSRGTLLSILPYPLARLLTMCSPLPCNSQMTTMHKEHRYFTKMHTGPLGTAVLGCSGTQGLSLIHPLPCTILSAEDAIERINKGHAQKTALPKD